MSPDAVRRGAAPDGTYGDGIRGESHAAHTLPVLRWYWAVAVRGVRGSCDVTGGEHKFASRGTAPQCPRMKKSEELVSERLRTAIILSLRERIQILRVRESSENRTTADTNVLSSPGWPFQPVASFKLS